MALGSKPESVRRLWLGAAAMLLAGCAPGAMDFSPQPDLAQQNARASDLALAELAKGDYAAAQHHALAAVEREPGDPYALLAAAMVHEKNGKPELARHYYQVLATMNPPVAATVGTRPPSAPLPLSEIARAGYRRTEAPLSAPAPGLRSPSPAPAAAAPVEPIEARFLILRALFEAGLVAEEEYQKRRTANLGGLLPFTGPTPAPRLNRQPPTSEQFVQRLQSLAKAFEMRALGAAEYEAERTAILDGLLPAVAATSRPVPPPRDELAMAAAVGRLERLRAGGLIAAAELERERKAMEQVWAPPAAAPAPPPAAAQPAVGSPGAAVGPQSLSPAGRAAKGGAASVHLASFATEAQAWEEWGRLRQRFSQLGELTPSVKAVTAGSRGRVYRLLAGPLADAAAVERFCRALKSARQYCAAAP
ncbi:MAG: SPOR domain-containing protein [Rhodospirillales bacterium]|nr:SPOR domain-containing protein [Rhodospirillales bacterium]